MRKVKRFTPELFEKFKKIGRGLGTFEDYIPFHRVSRSDASSIGRSHLVLWKNRHIELLSDGELVAFYFSTMVPSIYDIREQFPLSYESATHEITSYVYSEANNYFDGTNEISEKFKIKHPLVKGNGLGNSAPWVMTTDLLLTLKDVKGKVSLLAISCKPKDFSLENRAKELMTIEREYWHARGVDWLLITPELYNIKTAYTLKNTCSWALDSEISEQILQSAAKEIYRLEGSSLTHIIQVLSKKFGRVDIAQKAFWQNVWRGFVPLDLNRGWRPSEPCFLMSSDDFMLLNPIASRRTSWK